MRLIFGIILLVISLSAILSPLNNLIYAEEIEQLELPKISVNPGSFYYPFKRLAEKAGERLNFSEEQKISYYSSLLKKRLSELDFVTSNKVLSQIQGSSERFSFQAGVLTEIVEKKKIDEKKKLIKIFEKYSKLLANLRDKYPANSSFWMLVQHDINSLSILSERLK